jgi:hypothetical protein
MQSQDLQSEIAALEIQLTHYEKLFDQSIKDNVEFAKTKFIFHEMKKITERLSEIKKGSE